MAAEPPARAAVAAGPAVALGPLLGLLGLLVAALLAPLAGGAAAVVAGALAAWLAWGAAAPPVVRVVALAGYLLLAGSVLAGRPDLAGAALAPLAALALAVLLPRRDPGPAAADWGAILVTTAWAATGALGLIALTALPGAFGSAAVLVLAMLVAFNAGRRAALIQGMSERVAIGIGAALAVLGSLMLQGGGLAVAAVAGLILGLALLAYAPAPPLPAAPAARQIVLTYQQIVCVAPLSAVIIALSRAFFP